MITYDDDDSEDEATVVATAELTRALAARASHAAPAKSEPSQPEVDVDLALDFADDPIFADAPARSVEISVDALVPSESSEQATVSVPTASSNESELAFGDDDGPELAFGDPDEPELAFGEAEEPSLAFGDDNEPELAFGDDDEPELAFGDDDEPELAFGDDDEPELAFGDDDEPELAFGDDDERSLAFGDDDAVVPDNDPFDEPVDDGLAVDRGAAAAQRSVTRRKPRKEDYRFVGHSTDAQRARVTLLQRLADHAEDGAVRAGLLLSAAEIEMQLGQVEQARELTRAAHEADPADLLALRTLRRDAMSRGDWSEVESFLRDELSLPLSPNDRRVTARLLAEVRLSQLNDTSGAVDAAESAGEGAVAELVRAVTFNADRRNEETTASLAKVAQSWGDPKGAEVAASLALRALERRGETSDDAVPAAGTLAALRLKPEPSSLHDFAERLQDPLLGELTERASMLAGFAAAAPESPAREGTRTSFFRTAARVAQRREEREAREANLERLAAATGGTARALALVDLAQARAERGDLDSADEALRDAHLADGGLQAVQVVREVIARRAGDGQRLARAIEDADASGRGAIEGAAKTAFGGDRQIEGEQLRKALEEGVAPLAADTLLLDHAAEQGDGELVRRQLRRQADRATGERRVGALLALAERSEAPLDVLAEARDNAPGHPAVTRPLARRVAADDPTRAAAAWLEESDLAQRPRAAYAALVAARIHLQAGQRDEAFAAARRAFDLAPGRGPAAWLLAGDFGEGLEGEELAIFLEELGDVLGGRAGAEAHAASALRTGATDAWARALEIDEADPVARRKTAEADAVDTVRRAGAIEDLVERFADHPGVLRLARLRAALTHEEGGDGARAAVLLREALEGTDDPLAERFLDRVELGTGGFARVAERRFARVRETAGTDRALAALESLAAVDLYERDDPRSAFLTLQSILEEAPGHLPTLRAIERYFMDQGRDDELTRIERSLAEHLEGSDGAAAARAAVELVLADGDARGDAADDVLLSRAPAFFEHGVDGRWLAERFIAAGAPADERAPAVAGVAASLSGEEQAGFLLEQRSAATDGAELARALESAEHGGHVLFSEARGELLDEAGEASAAAAAYGRAAKLAADDRHRLRLHVAEARCWNASENTDAAILALEAAAVIDVTYDSVFDELRAHYQKTGQAQKLTALAESRVAAGADEATLLSLHETQAELKTSLGDRGGAKAALQEALKIDPDRSEALERLARLCIEDEDWKGAAESLVRFARVKQSREKLRWVFFELGTIYDRHLPDPRRAEAAYRRVLKLAPSDLEALERLADFYFRHEMWGQATIAQKELHKREIDPDAKVAHLVRLSRAYEEAGKLRVAEQTLDEQRRRTPHDLTILRALADLYQRQNAASAHSMHLGRAVNDFRRRIQEKPAEAESWAGLVEVLGWRGQADGGRAVASAALAAGVTDITLSGRLDAAGGVSGAGAGASDPGLHELLAPALLTPATFEVFRQAGETLEKLLPFEPRAWRAEKADRSREALKTEALRIARWYGYSEVQLWIAEGAPRVCVPVADRGLGLVLGRELADRASGEERAFLFARAAKVASCQFAVAMRSSPEQLGVYLAALIKLYDPNHVAPGIDASAVDQAMKRLGRGLPRRVRDSIGAVVVEMGGTAGFDAQRLGLAAAQLGDRAALLALGNAPKAISALLRLAGIAAPGQQTDERVDSLRQVPEAYDLLAFATGDKHFEARRRVGADRG
ncbi:MAG: hypothetical protein AAF411_12565 [Myxococcota bacterium]